MEHYLQGEGGDPPDLNLDYAKLLPWIHEASEGDQAESK